MKIKISYNDQEAEKAAAIEELLTPVLKAVHRKTSQSNHYNLLYLTEKDTRTNSRPED